MTGALVLLVAAVGFARRALGVRRAAFAGDRLRAPSSGPARRRPVPAWVVVAVTAALIVVGRQAPAVLAAVLVAGAVAWRQAGSWAAARARRAAVDALPEAVDAAARALRAGWSLGPALEQAIAHAPPPLAAALAPLPDALRRGSSIPAAVSTWSTGTDIDGADLLAAALDLATAAGGDLAAALDGVADTLRDRRAARRESAALATHARASATLLGVAPVVFGALAAAIDPRTGRFLFTTGLGLGCLAAGLALDVAGWRWMRRISEVVT